MDTSPGTWRDEDPSRARVLQRFGMHSLMIVPLRARGNVLGIVTFFRSENPAPFSRVDLFLAEGLAARASLSLDNARRYSRERTAALALQRDLLPHILRSGDAVEVASRYLPADTHGGVGGDWFDVIPMSHDRVALVVGDVVGHGINAAATMGRLRMVLNTLTNLELPPAEVLARLDELVVGLARDRPEDGAHLTERGSHLHLRRLRPGDPLLHHGQRRAPPAGDRHPRRERRIRRPAPRSTDRHRAGGLPLAPRRSWRREA